MSNAKEQDLLSIGIVAQSFGVSENCIRRMESAGLLEPAYKSQKSGYRYYDSASVSRINTILALKSFGFVNEEIKEHFTHPEDYSVLYDILLKKQSALNHLIENMRHRLKNNGVFHCEISEYEATYCYTKRTRMVLSLNTLSELARDMFYEAIHAKLPINYNRALLLMSDCMDYRKFQRDLEQDFTLCLPLREAVDGKDILLVPAQKAVSFTWNYPEPDYPDIIPFIDALFKTRKLKQIDTLRASYDIGGHTGSEITAEDTIMHILVPVE